MLINLFISFFLFVPCSFAADQTSTPDKIKLEDYACTNGVELYGRISCAKLKPKIVTNLENKVSHMIHNYKTKGTIYKFQPNGTGFCLSQRNAGTPAYAKLPICDYSGGDSGSGRCGSFCQINKDGIIDGTCNAEKAYKRGLPVQAQIQFLEQIESELNAGEIVVHKDNSGGKPCAGYALALIKGYDGYEENGEHKVGVNEAQKKVAALVQTKKQILDTSELSTLCRRDDKIADNSRLGESTKLKESISTGLCTLSFMHLQLQSIFEEFVACEWKFRSDEYTSKYISKAGVIDASTESLFANCSMGAEGESYEDEDHGSNQWWDEAWHWVSNWVKVFRPNKALQKLQRCYADNVMNIIIKDINKVVKSNDKKKLQPYKNMPPIKDDKGNTITEFPNCSKQASNGNGFLFFGIGMIGSIGFRKRRSMVLISALTLLYPILGHSRTSREEIRAMLVESFTCADGSNSQTEVDYYYSNGSGPDSNGYDNGRSICGRIVDDMPRDNSFFRKWSFNYKWAAVMCCLRGEHSVKQAANVPLVGDVNVEGCQAINDSQGWYHGIILKNEDIAQWNWTHDDVEGQPNAYLIKLNFERFNGAACGCTSPIYRQYHQEECKDTEPDYPEPNTILTDFQTQSVNLQEITGTGGGMANATVDQDDPTKTKFEANAATADGIRLSGSKATSATKRGNTKSAATGGVSTPGSGSDGGFTAGAGGSGLTASSSTSLGNENAAIDAGEKETAAEYAAGKKMSGTGGKSGKGGGWGDSDIGHGTGLSAMNMGGQGSTGPVSDMSEEDYFKMAGSLGLFERVNKKYGSVGDKFIHEAARDDFDRLKAH